MSEPTYDFKTTTTCDLNEDSLLEATIAIRAAQAENPLSKPTRLMVTPGGFALQAERLRSGVLAEADLRHAGIPEPMIRGVKALAEGMAFDEAWAMMFEPDVL